MVDGTEFTASAKNEGTLVADDSDESGTTTRDAEKSVTTKETKVFTLRINDMTWI